MPHGSDWAALNVELLSEVLTLVSLRTKIVCESVCKTWRNTLRDEPEQGLWGNMVSLQSLPCELAFAKMGGNNVMISVPPSSKHSTAVAAWLVQRLRGMKQVVLGYPKKRSVLVTFPLPVDDGSFSATHQVLSSMTAIELEESFQLAIFEMDPSLLLDDACHQVLVKHCVGLSLAAGPVELTPAHMQALCSLTKLKVLELEANMPIRQSPSDVYPDLPQDLTRLTNLHKLTALSFPALPLDFSHLQKLNKLYLAPPELIPHDLSTHTHLTKLQIGTRYAEPLPLALPAGPNVSLKSLILHSNCKLQHLEDCKELTNLEIVPQLGLHMLWDGAFPTSLPHLTQLVVDDPAELHGESEVWGKLPDEWQHYTALRQLSIPDLVLEALPEWITTLSELRILEMQGLSFDNNPYFPSILRHMPKLQILNMERMDVFIAEEIVHLAQIPNLVLLVFGCIGEDLRDDHPLPPLEDDEVLCFQQLAVALEAHPNKLMQTRLSASCNQIWTFRSIRGGVADRIAFDYMSTMTEGD